MEICKGSGYAFPDFMPRKVLPYSRFLCPLSAVNRIRTFEIRHPPCFDADARNFKCNSAAPLKKGLSLALSFDAFPVPVWVAESTRENSCTPLVPSNRPQASLRNPAPIPCKDQNSWWEAPCGTYLHGLVLSPLDFKMLPPFGVGNKDVRREIGEEQRQGCGERASS